MKEECCPCSLHFLYYIPGNMYLIDAIPGTVFRSERQTDIYDETLKQHARPHPQTRIMTGTVGRYAPHEWPDW